VDELALGFAEIPVRFLEFPFSGVLEGEVPNEGNVELLVSELVAMAPQFTREARAILANESHCRPPRSPFVHELSANFVDDIAELRGVQLSPSFSLQFLSCVSK